jgi:multisubunit Na+/H+ antiporter MnhB subunit
MRSSFLNLNAKDFIKGLIVALITAVIAFLYEWIAAGKPLDLSMLKTVGLVALSAGLAYILKNLGTNSQGQILKTEKPIK